MPDKKRGQQVTNIGQQMLNSSSVKKIAGRWVNAWQRDLVAEVVRNTVELLRDIDVIETKEAAAREALQLRSHLEALSHECTCPIRHTLMKEPVVAADGHTYDREAIERWLRRHSTSPMTGLPLAHLNLVPNIVLGRVVRQMREAGLCSSCVAEPNSTPTEFCITIDKRGTSKIGLDIVIQDGVALKIKKVKEGLVSEWNAAHPDQRVHESDSMTQVNGVSGCSEKMLETIARDETLNLVITRPG